MKIENERYVLTKEINGEVVYLTEQYGFDNDIREALKAKNVITAQFIRNTLMAKYKIDLDIITLKITYEW